jgi:hypothetical protein
MFFACLALSEGRARRSPQIAGGELQFKAQIILRQRRQRKRQ